MTDRLRSIVTLFTLSSFIAGCGLATLAHDSLLGPVSPAGRIHDATVGRNFRVTTEGPTAEAAGEPRLRPFPSDLVRRLGSPASFRALARGLEALAAGTSVVVDRRREVGPGWDVGNLPAAGATVTDVLRVLGPPDLWARRQGGGVMLYRSESVRALSMNLGVPPAAAGLIPVPGVASLAFRWTSRVVRSRGAILFFDAEGKLTALVPTLEGPQ
jgi:hypothetical protein